MKLNDLVETLSLEILQERYEESDIFTAYTSDLLSDVMAHAKENSVLITIQSHKNSVAVASLTEQKGIIVCNNRPVPEDMIQAARDENIGIFRTEKSQYIISGIIYSLLNKE